MSEEILPPVAIAVDFARPGSDRTVMSIHGGRRLGKTAAINQAIENALNNGVDVYDTRTGEYRGAGAARDVTPKTKLIEQK